MGIGVILLFGILLELFSYISVRSEIMPLLFVSTCWQWQTSHVHNKLSFSSQRPIVTLDANEKSAPRYLIVDFPKTELDHAVELAF
jgi:hypothetical protein